MLTQPPMKADRLTTKGDWALLKAKSATGRPREAWTIRAALVAISVERLTV